MIPHTTIPFGSAFFLVLVGLFIGNLIWYRFRDEHENVAEHLKKTNRQLKERLRERETELQAAADSLDSLQSQSTQLTHSLSHTEHLAEQAALDSREAGAQLSQERKAREDLAACLSDEQRKSQRLERDAKLMSAKISALEQQQQDSVQSLSDLQLQHDSLASAHQKLQDEHAIEAQTHQRAKKKLTETSQQLASLSRSRDQLQLERHSLRGQVDSMSSRLELATQEAVDASSLASSVEEELQQKLHQVSQLAASVEELSSERDVFKAELNRRNDELQAISFAKAELADRLVRRDHELRELSKSSDDASLLRERLRQLESTADYVNSDLEQLRHEHGRTSAELQTARSEAAEEQRRNSEAVHRYEQQLASLERQVSKLTQGNDRHLVRQHELESKLEEAIATASRQALEAQQQREALKSESESAFNRVEFEALGLKVELDTARKRVTQLDQECEILRNELELARNERDGLQRAGDEKLELLNSAEEKLRQEEARVEHLSLGIATTESRLESMKVESARLEGVEDELIARDTEVVKLRGELASFKDRCTQAIATESATREIVAELRNELAERLETLDEIQANNTELDRQLGFERQESQRWRQTATRAEEQLVAERESFDQLQQRHEQADSELVAARDALSVAKLEAADYERRCQRAQAKVDELTEQLDAPQVNKKRRKRRFVGLDRSKGDAASRSFSFRGLRERERSIRDEDLAKLVDDPQLGAIFVAPPASQDDLQKVPALTSEMASELNRMGIYCYHQIVGWDDKVMLAVATHLRIGRLPWQHDWIDHARKLMRESDDRFAA